MTSLLAIVRDRRRAWLIPAAAGSVMTGYLAWGAWVSAHDPGWLYSSQSWWRVWLRPGSNQAVVALVVPWIVALVVYWWPRRALPQMVGLAAIVAMVVIGGVLGTASLVPCRGGQTVAVAVAWVLGLYVGNSPSVYPSHACPGQPPVALQLGQATCLGAILLGALAAAVLWRQPVDRLRARLIHDAIVFTGLDSMTIPLLRQLAWARPGNVVVIEPDGTHPLLDEARAVGVRVLIGDPASPRVLQPVLAGVRGCTLSFLFALRQEVEENEAVLAAAHRILRRYRPDPEQQPRLIARVDDPAHANDWRGWRCGTSSQWLEDALSVQESTACALANRIAHIHARQLVLCGDSTLALAILLELARRTWEQQGLIDAAAIGRAAYPDAADTQGPDNTAYSRFLKHVVLLDRRAEELRREYLTISPHSMPGALPAVTVESLAWNDHLLAMLDSMTPADAAETAVVITDVPETDDLREAARAARLHPDVPVLVLTGSGASASGAIFDELRPFQRTLLVDDQVPEDTWSRVARHWHECFRLRNPVPPSDPRAPTRRPWAELDAFIRQDNILQVRTVMTAVVARGRRWVPRRAVAPGSFIELSDQDLEEIARAEHTRWYKRRLAAGWKSSRGRGDNGAAAAGNAQVSAGVLPWDALPAEHRKSAINFLRSQLAQLEALGLMPIVPEGGPPEAAKFHSIATVRARQLPARHRQWNTASSEGLTGGAGDWLVIDDSGDEHTISDPKFRASHEPLDDGLWRRTGTVSAWQASESVILRTLHGRAIAQPGDWVAEGPRGERWPLADEKFRESYQPGPEQSSAIANEFPKPYT